MNEPTLSGLFDAARACLNEARIYAEPTMNRDPVVLGFAAMSLTLSCMTAIGEQLAKLKTPGVTPTDEACIGEFVKNMTGSNEWIRYSTTFKNQISPADLLVNLRNSLAHALSLPNKSLLVETPGAVDETLEVVFVIPSIFVSAVSATVADLAKTYGREAFIDSTRRNTWPRSPATIVQLESITGIVTSGSAGIGTPIPPEKHDPPP